MSLEDFKDRGNLGVLVINNLGNSSANVFYRGITDIRFDNGVSKNETKSPTQIYYKELSKETYDKILVYDIDTKEIGYLTKIDYIDRAESIPDSLFVSYPTYSWNVNKNSELSTKFLLDIEDSRNGNYQIEVNKEDIEINGSSYNIDIDKNLLVGDTIKFRVRGLEPNTDYSNFSTVFTVRLKEINLIEDLNKLTYTMNIKLNTLQLPYKVILDDLIIFENRTEPYFSFEITKNFHKLRVECDEVFVEKEYNFNIEEFEGTSVNKIEYRKISLNVLTNNGKWKVFSNITNDSFITITNNSWSFIVANPGLMDPVDIYVCKTNVSKPSQITNEILLKNTIQGYILEEFPPIEYSVDDSIEGSLIFTFMDNDAYKIRYKRQTDNDWIESKPSRSNEIRIDDLYFGETYNIEINSLKYNVWVAQDDIITKDLPTVLVNTTLGFYKSVIISNAYNGPLNNRLKIEVVNVDSELIKNIKENEDGSVEYVFTSAYNVEDLLEIKYKMDNKYSKNSYKMTTQLKEGGDIDIKVDDKGFGVNKYEFIEGENPSINITIKLIDKYPEKDDELTIPIRNSDKILFSTLNQKYSKYNYKGILSVIISTLRDIEMMKIKEYYRKPRAWVLGESSLGYSTYLVNRELTSASVMPPLPYPNPKTVTDA